MQNRLGKVVIGVGVFVAIALVLALTNGSPTTTTEPESAPTITTAPPTTTTTEPRLDIDGSTIPPTSTIDVASQSREVVADLVSNMSTTEVARQLVVTGLTGDDARRRLSDVVGSSCIGGVFVTESNNNWAIETDVDAARTFIRDIRDSAILDLCTVPPLAMTDAELGEIVRVPVEAPDGPRTYSDGFADAVQFDVLSDLGRDVVAYAEALAALDIDVNFGAVADVDTDPSHFMARSGRTFGADASTVAAMSQAVVAAHCSAGVAPTLKHFPNQGATPEDPHRERSIAVGGVALWEDTGRLPYAATTAPIVMTGHIFLDIDPDMPASMSAPITTGLLRDQLGFGGLIVTDDLSTMRGAIDVVPDAGDRAVAAIRAGATLVLYVDDTDIERVVEAITAEMVADADFAAMARANARHMGVLKAALGRLPTISESGIVLC
ncbi:MAG: glycoside hydrolase family 3 N-terminal domain-containing protein [Acidimicrobiales bacterium]|nr:glycoside hydrolase family 3 N-terminal domain-containing protein [Acidimicrobiales bacterium]